jgi:hypothetical protein
MKWPFFDELAPTGLRQLSIRLIFTAILDNATRKYMKSTLTPVSRLKLIWAVVVN